MRPPGARPVFILLIYRDPETWDPLSATQRAAVAREHDAFQASVSELVFTEALDDPAQTVTVRVRSGKPAVTRTRYLDTRAFVCGYYLIDSDSRDRAVELASRVPDARYAAVEVHELTYQFGTQFAEDADG
jgi:hypothetical protein